MKFILFTTIIVSVAVVAGADDAWIIGHPCAQASEHRELCSLASSGHAGLRLYAYGCSQITWNAERSQVITRTCRSCSCVDQTTRSLTLKIVNATAAAW
ncbi:uncharacterized protein EDB91DRAFT_1153877 [Suillus paluster]|uniref:uncharacterized protein n=1 Tax=Suillus paluster TaxID=48578 RepID=UPI001B8644B9|nr:uncharacterized protein EDB91DRAFT_1153877 [Suillus paluster]KAG1731646.1 hypothetical protein EDB91DRAFT_1153877 [Suillus paluster]